MTRCILCHLEIIKGVDSSLGCPNGHLAHIVCLQEWLLHSSNCPLCREPYPERVILEFSNTQRPKSPVSLRGATMRGLKQLFSRRAQSGQKIAQSSEYGKKEERPRLSDEDIMILDLESEEGIKLMKQYKKQIGESATQRGKETESFVKWLKGEKVETRELKDLIPRERMSSEIIKIFKFIEDGIRIKDFVERALEILARLMLLCSKYYDKELDSFLEKIKQCEDYDEDKYPYSEILKLYSGDNEYRRNFLQEVRRREGNYKDRYPYPYIFKPPEPPDDLATAPRVQVHASPKKEDPKNEIHCQYCGIKLTKEEQFTHSCKKKPE